MPETVLTEREVFALISAGVESGLVVPLFIYTLPDRRHLTLRIDDDAPADVVYWATHLGIGSPELKPHVFPASGDVNRPWREYSARQLRSGESVPGWTVQVWCSMDALDQVEGGAESSAST